jgi:hypothetical protein
MTEIFLELETWGGLPCPFALLRKGGRVPTITWVTSDRDEARPQITVTPMRGGRIVTYLAVWLKSCPFTTQRSLGPVDSRGGYPISRVLARSRWVLSKSRSLDFASCFKGKHDASFGMTVFENVLRHG